jgi:serine-type D-Ala-D-Ala carboxypeptidase (penicillin-binding protein 5/6)
MLSSLISFIIAGSNLGPAVETDLPQTENIPIIRTASTEQNVLKLDHQKPIKNEQLIAPIIEAKAAIAVDMNTGEILYDRNPDMRLSIASITKLMTILIILEENDLEEITSVSQNANQTQGSTMHLHTGEEISIENLVRGALIHSANDAAVALAEHNAGNVNAFVQKMNTRAADLGLSNTSFSNPIGLDHPHNYSSVKDIVKLANFVYQNDFVKDTASIKKIEVKSTDGEIIHNLESTNELLDSYLNIKGLKTGKTDGAGLCLVSIAENKEGKDIITVVLNSPARFRESKILIDWTFRAYTWP